ncbi:MAG: hypothetical protein ABIG89_02690 [Candidatus Woesearchaeota archaeon]
MAGKYVSRSAGKKTRRKTRERVRERVRERARKIARKTTEITEETIDRIRYINANAIVAGLMPNTLIDYASANIDQENVLVALLRKTEESFSELGIVHADLDALTSAALELAPEDAEANHNKGSYFYKFSRYKEALPFYEKAVELTSDDEQRATNVGYHIDYCRTLYLAGFASKAKSEIKKGISNFSNEGIYNYLLAQMVEKEVEYLRSKNSKWVRAVHHYQDAARKLRAQIKQKPDSKNRAIHEKYLSTAEEAIKMIKREHKYHDYKKLLFYRM